MIRYLRVTSVALQTLFLIRCALIVSFSVPSLNSWFARAHRQN
jgi:hypothetical protein